MRVLIGCSCPRFKTQEKALEISTWPLSVFVCRLDDAIRRFITTFVFHHASRKGGTTRERPRRERTHPDRATAEAPSSRRVPRARVGVTRRAGLSTRLETRRASSRRRPPFFFSERAPEPRARLRDDARRRDASTRLCRLPRRPPTLAWPPSPPRATSRLEMCRPPAHERAASP